MKLNKYSENSKGFTLVEIIVVMLILAILAAVAIPSYLGFVKRADEAKAMNEAGIVADAAEIAYIEAVASEGALAQGTLIRYDSNINKLSTAFTTNINNLLADDIDTSKITSLGINYPKGGQIYTLLTYNYDSDKTIYYCKYGSKTLITADYDAYIQFFMDNAS